MALKVKGKVYNDGVLTVCRQVDRKTDFAARRNPKASEDLTPIAKMAFRHISRGRKTPNSLRQWGSR